MGELNEFILREGRNRGQDFVFFRNLQVRRRAKPDGEQLFS